MAGAGTDRYGRRPSRGRERLTTGETANAPPGAPFEAGARSGHESYMFRDDPRGRMSGRAGSDCPECGGQLRSNDGGMNYRCRDCSREFDSADVFLL